MYLVVHKPYSPAWIVFPGEKIHTGHIGVPNLGIINAQSDVYKTVILGH